MQPDYKILPEDEQSRVDEQVRKEAKKRTKHITDKVMRMSGSDLFTETDIGSKTKEAEEKYVESVKDISGRFEETVNKVGAFLKELSSEQIKTNPFGEQPSSEIDDDKIKLLNDLTNKYLAPVQSKIAEYNANQDKENQKKQKSELYFQKLQQYVDKYGEPPPEGYDINADEIQSYMNQGENGHYDFTTINEKGEKTIDFELQKKIDAGLTNYLKDVRDADEKKTYWDNNVEWFSPIWESKSNQEFVKGLAIDIVKGILGVYGIPETFWEHAQKQNENLDVIANQVKDGEYSQYYNGIYKDELKDDNKIQAIKDLNLFSQPHFRERPFIVEALKSTVTSLAALPMYMYGLGELKLMQPIAEIGWKTFAKNLLKSPFYTQLPQLTGQVLDQIKQGHIKNYGDFISLIGKTYVQGLAEVIGEVSTGVIEPFLPKGMFKKILGSRFGKEIDLLAGKLNIDIEKSARFLVTQPFAETFEEEISNLIVGDPSVFTGDFNPRRLGIEAISALGMGLPLSVWYGKIKNDDIGRIINKANELGVDDIELDRKKIAKLSDKDYQEWNINANKRIQEVDKSQIIEQFGKELYDLIGSKAQETFNANEEEVKSKIAEVVDNNLSTPSEVLESVTKPFIDGTLQKDEIDIVSKESLQGKTFNQIALQVGINTEAPSTIKEVHDKITNAVIGHRTDDEVVNAIIDKVGHLPVYFDEHDAQSRNGAITKEGEVLLNKNAVNQGTNDILYTLLHEGAHAFLGNRLNTDPKFKARVETLIANVYHTDPEIARFVDDHLIGNYPQDRVAEEFLTNVFSRDSILTRKLREIPAAKRETFIGKIVDFIKDIFGLKDNTYNELKKIVFGEEPVGTPIGFTENADIPIDDLLNQINKMDSDEAKSVEPVLSEPLSILSDEKELSGLEESKIEESLPELRQAQSIGSSVKQLLYPNGRQVFANNKELRDAVFGLGDELTHQQRFDKFIEMLQQRGVDFNNSLIVKLSQDFIRDTGMTYFHHVYHSIITSTEQTVAIISANHSHEDIRTPYPQVTLIGKGTAVSSYLTQDGTPRSTVGRKQMTEVIQEQLKLEGGLDIQIYEIIGFENIAPAGINEDGTSRPRRVTKKNSFKDFRPWKFSGLKNESAEDKMSIYRRGLLSQGFVVIPTEKTHLLLDIRSFRMKDEQGNWQSYRFDIGKTAPNGEPMFPAWKTWEYIFSDTPLIKNARAFVASEQSEYLNKMKEQVSPYKDRTKLYGNRPHEKEIMNNLNNALFDIIHSYMFYQFASRVLPEAPSDKDLFKRLNNLGGEASMAIMFDSFKTNLPTSKEGNYMWLDGENVMFRSVVLDSSTITDATKLFGKDFKPGDGVAFILPQKRAMFNRVNLENKQAGIALKYKTFEIGMLLKKSDQVVHPDTHPQLWRFMIDNNIAEINFDTAVKVGTKMRKAGVQPITWQQITSYLPSDRALIQQHIFDRNMMNDSIMFSKDKVKDVARGVLPTYVRGALLYLLQGKARTRAYNHFLGGFDKLQKELNRLKDPKERLIALKRMAQNNKETGYSNSVLRFIENLSPEFANTLSLDIFSDLFLDGVVKKLLQDSLNHAQFGSSLTLMPDLGNYKQYLLKSGQITKEQSEEYFVDGYLKDGYMIMDYANYNNLQVAKSDNKVMLFVNPPSGYQDGRAMQVIGVLPKDMGVNGIVTPNNQLQIISGKDYDIDIAIPIPCNTELLQDMWQDLKNLDTDKRYEEDIKAFSNQTKALNLTLEMYPEIAQAMEEMGINSYEALRDSGLMKGKVAIEPEDAYLASDENGEEILGINPSFSVMSFKNPDSLNNFLAKLSDTGIGRLYNIALFYTEFLQYEGHAREYSVTDKNGNVMGAVKVSIDPSRIQFNLTMLNRLTHLVLDWLNNLKLFTFNYHPDKIINRLFKVDRIVQNGDMAKKSDVELFGMTAYPSIMSARKLLKFEEKDKIATFSGLWKAIKVAAEEYQANTLIGQSAVRANEIDISGFRINNEEQKQVYEYIQDQITSVYTQNWNQFTEKSVQALAALSEMAKREGKEGYTNYDRLSSLKLRSEQLGNDIYYRFLKEMFMYHAFSVPDLPRTQLQFKVNEDGDTGRVYIFNHAKDINGQPTGKLNYIVKEFVDGKELTGQVQTFDSFKALLSGQSGIVREREIDKIFHRDTFPAYLFSDPLTNFIAWNNDTFRSFLREFIEKTYNELVDNQQFKDSSEEAQRTFFYATLGYYGKQYSLENVQVLKEYSDENKRVSTVSYTDALMLMNQSTHPIAQQTFNTWLSTANEKVKQFNPPTETEHLAVTEFDPLLRVEGEDLQEFYGLISDEEALQFYYDSHMSTPVVKLIGGTVIPYTDYETMSDEDKRDNWIIARGTQINTDGTIRNVGIDTDKDSLVAEAKDFWVDSIFSAYDELNKNLGRKKDVKKQVRKIMAKALKASQGQPRDKVLEFFARNLPFARTILMFSNRNKVYPPQADVVTYYINGKKLTAKATEIASAFDLKYAEGSPIRISGAMIDWYVRLQSHYEASNTQNVLRTLTEKIIESLNGKRGNLLDVNNVAQSTTVQMAAWDIAEGKTKILKPGDFTFQSNQGLHQIVFNGKAYTIAANSIANIQLDSIQELAQDIINSKNLEFTAGNENEKRFKKDLLVRSVMASLQYRYIYDYVTPGLISTQIDNMNAILKQSLDYNPESTFRSMTISLTDQYINRLANMIRQIDGINSKLNAKGRFYMPITFEDKTINYEAMERKLTEIYVKKGFSDADAKKKAQRDVKLAQDETRHEVNGSNPLHTSYLKRLYEEDVDGYLKDYKVTSDYLDQLATMFRFQNLSAYEAFNGRFTAQENPFMLHELRFMSAVARNSEYYYEPIKKTQNLSRGQFIQFQVLSGDFFQLKSGEVKTADKDQIVLFNADGTLSNYDRRDMKNLQLMHGVSNNKKFTLMVRRVIGVEPEWLNRAVTFLSRNKLKYSNLGMLATKPLYAARNVAGASMNLRAYFGNSDYNAGQIMKERFDAWRTNNNGNFSDIETTVFKILVDHASAIMGDVDTVMGRFGGLVVLMQDQLTPETVRLHNERAVEWEASKEEFRGLVAQMKANPEDVGLKERFFTRIPQLVREKFDKWGMQNIPLGWPVGLVFPEIKDNMYVNAAEGEKYWRDRTVLTMANVMADHFNLYTLTGKDKETAEYIIRRFITTNVTHAVNTTQFQYLPGFFLSHFDSTLNGKAWFKQFSHYANSMEWAYIGRIENSIRQMQQFGIAKILKAAGFEKPSWKNLITWYLPLSEKKKLKYDALIGNPDKMVNMTFEEYVELSRAIRMTAWAICSSVIGRISKAGKTFMKTALGTNLVYSVMDVFLNNLLSESMNVPTVQVVVNWAFQMMSSPVGMPDDDDDKWELRLKKAASQLFGQDYHDYAAYVRMSMEKEMGSDYTNGFYGEDWSQNPKLTSEMLHQDYYDKILKDLFLEGVPFGVQENQAIQVALDMFMTGLFPNNMRQILTAFAQTQLPFSSVLVGVARNTELTKGYIPGYNRADEFKRQLQFRKEDEIARKKSIPKEAKFDIEDYVLEQERVLMKDKINEKDRAWLEFEEDVVDEYRSLGKLVKNGKMTKEQADVEIREFAKDEWYARFGYGPVGDYAKLIQELKGEYKEDKELNKPSKSLIKTGKEVK